MMGVIRNLRGKRRARRGFTLIELMVVVAIIAFVSAAIVPSFGITLWRGRQREAGNLVVQGVLAARSLAARSGRCHRMRIVLSDSRDDGGHGGAVVVQGHSSASRCSSATTGWQTRSVKCVGCDGDAIAGNPRAGLVGADVALDAAEVLAMQNDGSFVAMSSISAGSTLDVAFEPTGGMYMPRRLVIRASGAPVDRWVTIDASGSVRYGNR